MPIAQTTLQLSKSDPLCLYQSWVIRTSAAPWHLSTETSPRCIDPAKKRGEPKATETGKQRGCHDHFQLFLPVYEPSTPFYVCLKWSELGFCKVYPHDVCANNIQVLPVLKRDRYADQDFHRLGVQFVGIIGLAQAGTQKDKAENPVYLLSRVAERPWSPSGTNQSTLRHQLQGQQQCTNGSIHVLLKVLGMPLIQFCAQNSRHFNGVTTWTWEN